MSLLTFISWTIDTLFYFISRICWVALGFTLVFLFIIFVIQRKLIYVPHFPPGSRVQVPKPTDFDIGGPLKESDVDIINDKDAVKDMSLSALTRSEEVELITSDGVRLHAYWIQYVGMRNLIQEKMDPIVLYFHANAGNMVIKKVIIMRQFTLKFCIQGHRLPIARQLISTFPCSVYLLSYRGYAKSGGSPSEKGIKLDAEV